MSVAIVLASALRRAFFAQSRNVVTRDVVPRTVPRPTLAALATLGEQLRAHKKHRGKPLSMLVVQLHDIGELLDLFGVDAAQRALVHVFASLMRLARTQGMVLRTGTGTFTLLMPGSTSDELLDLFESSFGRAYSLEFELDHEEIVLVPEVLVRRVRSTETVSAAYSTLCHDLLQTRRCEDRRQRYLRRERESHTAPVPLANDDLAGWVPELPATIRMELG